MTHIQDQAAPNLPYDDEPVLSLGDIANALLPRWRLIAGATFLAGALGLGISYLIPPSFTAKTTFITPQQQQSGAAAALSSLGALAGLAGAGVIKSPADEYVALMQSVTVADRIIDRFKLMDVYKEKFRVDARKELAGNVRIAAGKKDNLISIEADDHDPQRAADMANAYLEELKKLSNGLALTEAQRRRMLFEGQLEQTRDKLAVAQTKLQKSGFNPGALKAEPKAAAESYARIKAEIAGGEVRLQTLRRTLTDNAPEMQQQLASLAALRAQLGNIEQPLERVGDQDYIGAYREFKYQEALFDIFARQFELAKLDESREGTLYQVVDVATPPERKSKPKRSLMAMGFALVTALGLAAWLVIRQLRLAVKPE